MSEDPQLPQGAFSEGADCYVAGLPRKDCPYPPGADEREEWLAGWDQTAARHQGQPGGL